MLGFNFQNLKLAIILEKGRQFKKIGYDTKTKNHLKQVGAPK